MMHCNWGWPEMLEGVLIGAAGSCFVRLAHLGCSGFFFEVLAIACILSDERTHNEWGGLSLRVPC